MLRWMKVHPFTTMFGLSLVAFYIFAFLELPSSRLLGILMIPAYFFRPVTGSLLYAIFPGVIDLFWLKELALVAVLVAPLFAIDALAVRFNRTFHLPGRRPARLTNHAP